MKIKLTLFLFCQMICALLFAQENKEPIRWQDIPNWTYNRISGAQHSNDGQWLAYVSGPMQGDLDLTLRRVLDTIQFNYKIGGASTTIQFNNDSKFVAFFESPVYKEIKANEKSKRPSVKKLKIVSLTDTIATVFENVQSFEFANEGNNWIAIRFSGNPTAPSAPPSGNKSKGSDLLLYNLYTKKSFNLGNVNDFSFNKSGQYLAYTVDATGQNGNGIFLFDLQSGLTIAVENDKANYNKINWNKEGTALALLKSKKDKNYKEPVYTLIGIKNIKGALTETHTYTGLDENQIMSGYGISENTIPYWSKDLNRIFFGIAKIEKEKRSTNESKIDSIAKDTSNRKVALRKDSLASDSGAIKVATNTKKTVVKDKKDLEKPDMIIWNWQDKSLQSSQRNQIEAEKRKMVMSVLDVKSKKFTSLADSNIKSITLSPNERIGYALDFGPYEKESNLNGQRFADIYIVDVPTGAKKLALERLYLNASRGISFSPNSDYLLYFNDGDYFTLNLLTLTKTNITENIPSAFVNLQSDHNVRKPATPTFGWTLDSKNLLIRDNYDLWKITADGKIAVRLTENWTANKIMVAGYNRIYEDDEYIDLKKDQYFQVFDDKTKKAGIALLATGTNSLRILNIDDIVIGNFEKAKYANQYFYSKEQSNKAPDIFTAQGKELKNELKLTISPSDTSKFALSAGSKLISYVNNFGDTLQATLFLPANYEEGKSYPTITYIYERLTDGTNGYSMPAFPGGGFNRAVYTSNGYAVLMPDIAYKLNDPGMSAVACVIPAVQAAIKTGIVDKDRVGLQGHSWGGYQTSFLITQTDIFKAAVAGAPLTNLISMYSLIYWNSGSTNQSIFESSQGRLTSGYWDNWEAYSQNSPIYHIKKVNTPLVIMHNDKDGAVDYTQGIEYFNGLRRLNKPVVMLTYNGENHGLRKEVNQKDYAVRMMEFFDHYLKGQNAPDWWSKGINYIDLPKHLEERAF